MRICIDLDGVIAALRRPGESYADVKPLPGAVEKLTELRKNGHQIVIVTARHMKTTGGNVGQVIARQGKTTLDWLEHHGIPYDEIWFGKPFGDVYIDDNAWRFSSWDEIAGDGSLFPESREQQMANNQGGE